MQLRKVCNHPNLFETRPVISPFAMEGITYHTASLATTPLDYDPFKHINLDVLNLKLINFSNTLSAIAQHRISEFHATSKYIEEVDSESDPPPRIPKGKIRLQINIKSSHQSSSSLISQHSNYHLTSRALPSVQLKAVHNIPISVCSSASNNISNNYPSPRLLLVSPNTSSSSPRSLSSNGNLGSVTVSESSASFTLTGNNPSGNIIKKLTITKPVSNSGQSNSVGSYQKVKMQIGKLVQTPLGQHILVNPIHSSPSSPSSTSNSSTAKTVDKSKPF